MDTARILGTPLVFWTTTEEETPIVHDLRRGIGVSQDNQEIGELLHTLFSRHPTAKETASPKERENKIVYLPLPPDTLTQPLLYH